MTQPPEINPEELPVFQAPTVAIPFAAVAPIEQDDLVAAIHELLTYHPSSAEEHLRRAQQLQNYATYLGQKRNWVLLLVGEMASSIHHYETYRHIPGISEQDFWEGAGWSWPEIKQLITIHDRVLPLLVEADYKEEEIQQIVESADPRKLAVLAKHGQEHKKRPKPISAEQAKERKDAIRELTQAIVAMPSGELRAFQKATAGTEPHRPIYIEGVWKSGSQGDYLDCHFQLFPQDARDLNDHLAYLRYSIDREVVDMFQIASELHRRNQAKQAEEYDEAIPPADEDDLI